MSSGQSHLRVWQAVNRTTKKNCKWIFKLPQVLVCCYFSQYFYKLKTDLRICLSFSPIRCLLSVTKFHFGKLLEDGEGCQKPSAGIYLSGILIGGLHNCSVPKDRFHKLPLFFFFFLASCRSFYLWVIFTVYSATIDQRFFEILLLNRNEQTMSWKPTVTQQLFL